MLFHSAVDKAHLRLAAAKAVLRLSRQWDQKIPVDVFYMTLRVSQVNTLCNITLLLFVHLNYLLCSSWVSFIFFLIVRMTVLNQGNCSLTKSISI